MPLETFTGLHTVNDIMYLIPLFMSLASFYFLTIKVVAHGKTNQSLSLEDAIK